MRDLKLKGQKYVDLLSDSGFKAVFGDEANKDIVIDFLNLVLEGERVVEDLAYLQGELSGRTVTSKGVRFDLMCKDVDGTAFVVEMQRTKNSDDFFERSVYYGSLAYSNQLKVGQKKYYVNPVYVIGIMEGRLYHEKEAGMCDVVSRYEFREASRMCVAPKTISCIFVQLGNFKLTKSECRNGFERWCYTLKSISKLDSLPDEFSEQNVLTRVFDACEIANFDGNKLLIYEKDMMTEMDYNHDMYFSREEGKAEGRAEGKAEVANSLKSMGVDMVTICKATGLTEEQVRAL